MDESLDGTIDRLMTGGRVVANDLRLPARDPRFDQAALVVADVLGATLVAEVNLDPRDLIGEPLKALETIVST